VARINDKSGRGNHATQATLAARPIYAVVPRTGRRNLLTYSEQFDNAAWFNAAGTVNVTANTIAAPDGTLTADKLVPAAATTFQVKRQTLTFVTGQHALSVYAKEADAGVHLELLFGNSPSGGAVFNLSSGAVLVSSNCTTSVSAADANGWRRFEVRWTVSGAGAGLVDVRVTESSSRDQQMAGNASKGIYVWGAQFETGSTATAYQRVVSQHDVSEASVEALHYLSFDGTDDSLATSAIDFTATDAVAVHAGLRKVSDAARGTIAELTASVAANNGGFHLTAPNAASDTFAFESKGTALTDAVATGIAAPATRILSGVADISADSNILRVNGVQADSDAGDQGTGNYANAILYVGRRGGASLPFNGHLYGLIVRGAASSTAQISSTETWLNRKTGAY
jgi:hypothetical protein